MTDTLVERVKDLLVDVAGVERSQLTLDALFMSDLGMDSLDVVSFVMALEETFDVEVSDSEAESVKTVGEACALLEAKLARTQSSK